MIVKKILKCASELIEDEELTKYFDGNEDTQIDESEAQKMLTALNMAISNVSANYINVCDRVRAKSESGFIKFNEISSHPIIQIKKVLYRGEPIKFKVHSDSIEVGTGEYEIVYSYFPNTVNLDETITYFPQLNELTFAYEVVAEYLFLKGQIDDAYVWDKRFKASILSIQRPCRNIILKKKRWW